MRARGPYTSHGLGIFAEVTDPGLLDLLRRLAIHSQMYAAYVEITINLGFHPADGLPSGLTNLRDVVAHIAMILSRYAPRTHTRSAHDVSPELGGVYELETLGRMHVELLRLGGGKLDVLVVDVLPSFPGRSHTLSGGMRDVYEVLGEFSPSAQALLVRTTIGIISEMSLLHNNARVAAGLPSMSDWATMGAFARDQQQRTVPDNADTCSTWRSVEGICFTLYLCLLSFSLFLSLCFCVSLSLSLSLSSCSLFLCLCLSFSIFLSLPLAFCLFHCLVLYPHLPILLSFGLSV